MFDPMAGIVPDSGFSPASAHVKADSLIRTATTVDAKRCWRTLTRAFEADPVCCWMWPDRRQYREAFPRFSQAFGGAAVDLGTAHYYEGFAGVALWLPPGSAPDGEAVGRIIEETTREEQRSAVLSIFEQMDGFHPHERHWHLPLIGVDPASQGRGIGSALLRRALAQCDEEGLTAYLEATSPRNVALYERHGFEALGVIEVADCPPIVPMLRKPR